MLGGVAAAPAPALAELGARALGPALGAWPESRERHAPAASTRQRTPARARTPLNVAPALRRPRCGRRPARAASGAPAFRWFRARAGPRPGVRFGRGASERR